MIEVHRTSPPRIRKWRSSATFCGNRAVEPGTPSTTAPQRTFTTEPVMRVLCEQSRFHS